MNRGVWGIFRTVKLFGTKRERWVHAIVRLPRPIEHTTPKVIFQCKQWTLVNNNVGMQAHQLELRYCANINVNNRGKCRWGDTLNFSTYLKLL